MNVANIGAMTSKTWTSRTAVARGLGSRQFADAIGNQGAATHFVLHGASEEMKEQGYTSVGSWADARTGNSTSVYKPADFDDNNPVYLIKTWDAQGNVTEREINMKEVNPSASDVYEMYAYSCYLSDSGKCRSAETAFMKSLPAGNDMSLFGLDSQRDIYTKKVNWMSIIKGWMDMQYEVGNMKGYMDFKSFYDSVEKPFREMVLTDRGVEKAVEKVLTDRGAVKAVEKAKGKGIGDVLGITTLPYNDTMSYGMSAFYSENSTPADPIIHINSNYGGEKRSYDVHVNEVNPRNASQLEMFALCCYQDDQGITDRGSFGSFSRMKTYADNDAYLGMGMDLQNPENAFAKFDWVSMLKRMADRYLQNVQSYTQYLDCGRLSAALEKGKNMYFSA